MMWFMSGPNLFGFESTEELGGGHCSRVWADETRVLKVPWRGEELTTGRLAAERMSGWPGVKVFASDFDSGALLMERLGDSLASEWSEERDEYSMSVFIDLARGMRRLASDGLMPLSNYVSRSDPLARSLLDTSPDVRFLHGDLHHHNILRVPNCPDGDLGWRVIDPKGLCGDPAYEAAAFVLNPIGVGEATRDLGWLFRRRIIKLAEGLGVPGYRVWAWSVVLSRDEDPPEDAPGWSREREVLEAMTDFH